MNSSDPVEKEVRKKESFQNEDMKNQLHDLEMKFTDLATLKNKTLGSNKIKFKEEKNVVAINTCCREAREQISEMRTLLKERNECLKECREKCLKVQQKLDEQREVIVKWNEELEANAPIAEESKLELQQAKEKLEGQIAELPASMDDIDEEQRVNEVRAKLATVEIDLKNCKNDMLTKRVKLESDMQEIISRKLSGHVCLQDEEKLTLMQNETEEITEFLNTVENKIKVIKAEVAVLEISAEELGSARQTEKNAFGLLHNLMDYFFGGVAREWEEGHACNQKHLQAMQANVDKLDRKMAAARSDLKTAEKIRKEGLSRIQNQMKRLNQKYKDVQPHVSALQLLVKK